jgi:thiamine biosynthesis lipoprotein
MYIDLSTIAKGYGVDVVAERVESEGIDNYLVEIGGELRLSGVKADDSHWRVAIEKPSALGRASQQEISVGNNAVATSGDYRQFFEQDGKRYSHLIDPVTGMPISHYAASVTVVHPSAMTADGLATAFMIMGPERAKIMAQEYDIALFMLVKENDGYSVYTSAEFKPFLIN